MGESHEDSLHRLVFANDEKGLLKALEDFNQKKPHPHVNSLDCRGHAPLWLAVALGRHHMLQPLISAGASVLLKTSDGWSAYQEATSFGDRDMMRSLLRRYVCSEHLVAVC